MAQFHSDIGNGKFGVLSPDQARRWVISKLAVKTSPKFMSNLQSCLNDVDSDGGKDTGKREYKDAHLLHASAGKKGSHDGCTLFWIERPGNVAKLVAVGSHADSTTYDIIWRVPDWRFTGTRLSLAC